MDEQKRKSSFWSQMKKNDSFLAIILVSMFVIGLSGGLLGGYSYLKFAVKSGSSTLGGSVSNVKVEEDSAVIDVAKKASPSVVSISGTSNSFDFFGNARQGSSAGTGFIVSSDGLILTNKHVVSDQNAKYTVFTNDGKEYKAIIKATDPLNDLAFVKIDAKNLPVLKLGNSDDIQVGQRVVAIGNALGQYQNSVTTGVVSAIGRAIQAGDSSGNGSESLENVIQTDAAINPGNSGGPLVNLEGQAIGINTAIDQQGQSIGFAIPINVAKTALQSVLTSGRVIRPMLGVRYIPITKEFAATNNLSVTEGAYLYGGNNTIAIIASSPASAAGLKEGDIITKINNDKISSSQSLSGILTKYSVGDKVNITYIRDGQTKNVTVTLSESK